jgi:MFS family permease
VLSVPAIGATIVIAPALLLYGTERLGKAVRSPAKDTLLSHAATRTGRGTAFGVHQGMDQLGAVAGPLLLAAVLWQHARDYRLAFAVLLIPGILVLALLFWLRLRVPDPAAYEVEDSGPQVRREDSRGHGDRDARVGLPPLLRQYIGVIALLSLGIASFPVLAFHAQTQGLLTPAQVPVLFALAMLVDGMSGLLRGRVYDRRGTKVLLVVPVAAGLAALAFIHNATLVWVGVAIWGVVNGVLDSTAKAVVTELVAPAARSVAFGWLALARGLGLLVAGVGLGVAYDRGTAVVLWLILGVNPVALSALVSVLARL